MIKLVLSCALAGLGLTALAGSTAAAPMKTIAVSIESRVIGNTQGTSHKGTFKLVGTTLEMGTVSSTIDNFRSGKRGGQHYEVIEATDTYQSKRGTLVIRTRDSVGVSAGYHHSVITGTWFVVRGTGIYKGARGSGHAAFVVLPPQGSSITSVGRLQGFLTIP